MSLLLLQLISSFLIATLTGLIGNANEQLTQLKAQVAELILHKLRKLSMFTTASFILY